MTRERFRTPEPGDQILRDELLMSHREELRLRQQVEQLAATNRNMSALLVAAEHRNNDMAKLLVTVRRMIESRDGAAVLAGIQEILVNVIGTEDFVIHATNDEGALVPIAGMGENYEKVKCLPTPRTDLAALVRAGRIVVGRVQRNAFPLPSAPEVAACVALTILDNVVGAIVIHRLLAHRETLNECDEDVLTLLAQYAGTAIMAADLRKEWRTLTVRGL